MPTLPGEPEAFLGSLSDLYPYVVRRRDVRSAHELPELPIPEKFQQLFRDWADGKVDFVGPQESSGGVAV